MPIFTDPVTGAVFYVPSHMAGYAGINTSTPPPPPPPSGTPPPRELPTRPSNGQSVPATSNTPPLEKSPPPATPVGGSVVDEVV